MSWFPQLGTGSVVQFPFRRTRKARQIENRFESGEVIAVQDPAAAQLEWMFSYQDLNDIEVQNLSALFSASKGSFQAFGFIDPFANLLGWSDDLSKPDWSAGLLTLTALTKGWRISNTSEAEQSLQQSLGIPGEYGTCFSVWVRSDSAASVQVMRGSSGSAARTGAKWSRLSVSGAGDDGTEQATFSLQLAPGATIEVFGFQVEVQPSPSSYRPTREARGIYPETWFDSPELTVTSTGAGRSACTIKLISRV